MLSSVRRTPQGTVCAPHTCLLCYGHACVSAAAPRLVTTRSEPQLELAPARVAQITLRSLCSSPRSEASCRQVSAAASCLSEALGRAATPPAIGAGPRPNLGHVFPSPSAGDAARFFAGPPPDIRTGSRFQRRGSSRRQLGSPGANTLPRPARCSSFATRQLMLNAPCSEPSQSCPRALTVIGRR